MNESEKLLTELKDIREIMERSGRFLSLSGLSGILTGIYALVGAFFAYRIVYVTSPDVYNPSNEKSAFALLIILGASVLMLSLITILFLTIRQARKENKTLWGPGSRLLLMNLAIPLATGGILTVILASRGIYGMICASFLIFYGLALVNASKYTRPEILWLGIIEILLGIAAALFPGYGLYFWAAGFGIVHLVYGFIHMKNERKVEEN